MLKLKVRSFFNRYYRIKNDIIGAWLEIPESWRDFIISVTVGFIIELQLIVDTFNIENITFGTINALLFGVGRALLRSLGKTTAETLSKHITQKNTKFNKINKNGNKK